MNLKYQIQDREAGNVIEKHLSLNEAEDILELMEREDRKDGTYTENFYEIVEM
jgi:hypothetical protein